MASDTGCVNVSSGDPAGCDDIGAVEISVYNENTDDDVPVPSTTTTTPTADPEGSFNMASCDLGSGHELIGSIRVKNTGTVPLKGRAEFTWLLGDGTEINAEPQVFKLDVGDDDLLFFTTKASLNTQLSFQDHPDYNRGKNCKTNVKIWAPEPSVARTRAMRCGCSAGVAAPPLPLYAAGF